MATKPFSPIQDKILSRLKNAKTLRYSELKPKEYRVPNDLFNYHLQHLVTKKFVLKTKNGYSLSSKGVKHVADPYPQNNAITSLFKVNVITIVSRIRNGRLEILNQERRSNPSYGKVGVMGGVVLKGEKILDAARRKLEQETGLKANFKLLGCERRIMYREGELFSDVLFPIAYAHKSSGTLLPLTQFGKNFWVPITKAIQNESAPFDSIKAISTVLKKIKVGKVKALPYFLTEEVQTDGVPIIEG